MRAVLAMPLLAACAPAWESLPSGRDGGPPASFLSCFILEPEVLDFGRVDRMRAAHLRTRTLSLRNSCEVAVTRPNLFIWDADLPGPSTRFELRTGPRVRIPAGESLEIPVIAGGDDDGTYRHPVLLVEPETDRDETIGTVTASLESGRIELYGALPTPIPVLPGCGTRLRFHLAHRGTLPVHVDAVYLPEASGWSLELAPDTPDPPWAVTADNARDHAILLSLPATEDPGPHGLHLRFDIQGWQDGGVSFHYRTETTAEAVIDWNDPGDRPGWVQAPLVQWPRPGSLHAVYRGEPVPFSYDADANALEIEVELPQGGYPYVEIRYTPRCEP